METIRQLREFEKQAKAQLKELETLKAEKEATDAAKLTETEKLQRRLAEIEAKAADAEKGLIEERRKNRVAQVAAGLGAIDPHDANILAATANIDPASATVDEEIKKLLDALKAAKPYLFRQAGVTLAPFNPAGSPGPAETDAQRVARLNREVGIRSYGPLGG